MTTNRSSQAAVAELLNTVLRPWDYARDMPHDRLDRIRDAAECLKRAQADEEYASWLVKEDPRCDAS